MSERKLRDQPAFNFRRRTITADELYEMIEASPNNTRANSTAMCRSGRGAAILSPVDLEALAEKINERMAK